MKDPYTHLSTYPTGNPICTMEIFDTNNPNIVNLESLVSAKRRQVKLVGS